jgi:hypothetical protein
MTDSKTAAETATSATIEPVVVVHEGTGKTANISGAKEKEVHNVSAPNYRPQMLFNPRVIRADDHA